MSSTLNQWLTPPADGPKTTAAWASAHMKKKYGVSGKEWLEARNGRPQPTPAATPPTPAPAPQPAPAAAPTPAPAAPQPAPAPVLASMGGSIARLTRKFIPAPAGMNWVSATALLEKDHEYKVASGDQEAKLEVQGFPEGDPKLGFWCWVYNPSQKESFAMEVVISGDAVEIKAKNLFTREVKSKYGQDSETNLRRLFIGALTAIEAHVDNQAKAAAAPTAPPEAPSVP